MREVVIVGGGQAGYQTAASLRTEGFEGSITLIGDEPHAPYQRPPLSKAFVLGKQDREKILLRPEVFYRERGIRLVGGETVASIDRVSRRVRLESGAEICFDTLVLAVGARNRKLPVPGAELDGVCYLRTLSEAVELKQRLEAARNIVVIGGGFIGLEIAASARILGKPVTVLEALPRLMARVVAPVVSEFFRAAHVARGVEVVLNAQVRELRGEAGKVREVILADGRVLASDLVIVGIGIVPNTELASAAGLPVVLGGISVDEFLRAGDANIFAIGDCAEYHNVFAGARVRLESVQNAVDHAVCVARTIAGKPVPYHAAPWFWSDQFDIRLQMAGLGTGHDRTVVRGNIESGKFSVFYFRGGRLCSVDSVNRPADHLAARKLLASGTDLTPEQAADENVSIKTT
ncbi:MAG TPA: FAD-dependent oxidoreductase [Bryobacteraceae bacterium]|jgi:3-phenylpropionate/trans-cinnamate dioxygenase ferredoxin reductase subunit